MISYIAGKLISTTTNDKDRSIEILTSSGVGYTLSVPTNVTVPKEGGKMEIYVSMQVREDSQTLYGFLTREDRDLFEMLISVSGIGPKIGLAILSAFSKEEIYGLVIVGDHKSLSRAPGLGKKGSQKLILELQGKFEDLGLAGDASKAARSVDDSMMKDLKNALKALGFTGEALREMVVHGESTLRKNQGASIEELVKLVLAVKE